MATSASERKAPAVIAPDSILTGQAAGRLELHRLFDINLLAVSRSGERLDKRLRDIRLRAGDVIVLQGVLSHFPGKLQELGCLPLAEREVRLGNLSRAAVEDAHNAEGEECQQCCDADGDLPRRRRVLERHDGQRDGGGQKEQLAERDAEHELCL